MITYLPVDKVIQFARKNNLGKYSNIYAGTEGNTFFVRNYYNIQQLPYTVLYAKNGDRVQAYPQGFAIAALCGRLNKLK